MVVTAVAFSAAADLLLLLLTLRYLLHTAAASVETAESQSGGDVFTIDDR